MAGAVLPGDANMSDIVKGSRVAYDFNRFSGRLQFGLVTSDVVKDPLKNQLKALIRWDNSAEYEVYISTLILEEDAKIKQAKLEEEFSALQKVVSVKMDEAAKLISEANELARGTQYHVSDLLGDYSSFETETSSAGWNTSSWSC